MRILETRLSIQVFGHFAAIYQIQFTFLSYQLILLTAALRFVLNKRSISHRLDSFSCPIHIPIVHSSPI